ncbi:tetratricopeptide-like helical domain, DYW domain protein [Artemisia annua]|uniref:Tetratricopeptide-like helical domain, DYW domain protein n=1 Tax=Artemisia annua TaxID=35608 RepID=A0A2U1L2L7_ARTAN|nr:tetratricopeptide-like helical domain, DYW domain protein [Artemisia annua]
MEAGFLLGKKTSKGKGKADTVNNNIMPRPVVYVNIDDLNARMLRLKGIDAGNVSVSQPKNAFRVLNNSNTVNINEVYELAGITLVVEPVCVSSIDCSSDIITDEGFRNSFVEPGGVPTVVSKCEPAAIKPCVASTNIASTVGNTSANGSLWEQFSRSRNASTSENKSPMSFSEVSDDDGEIQMPEVVPGGGFRMIWKITTMAMTIKWGNYQNQGQPDSLKTVKIINKGYNWNSMFLCFYVTRLSNKALFGKNFKWNLRYDVVLKTGLLEFYAKVGDLSSAKRVYNEMPRMDVVGNNAMISTLR